MNFLVAAGLIWVWRIPDPPEITPTKKRILRVSNVLVLLAAGANIVIGLSDLFSWGL